MTAQIFFFFVRCPTSQPLAVACVGWIQNMNIASYVKSIFKMTTWALLWVALCHQLFKLFLHNVCSFPWTCGMIELDLKKWNYQNKWPNFHKFMNVDPNTFLRSFVGFSEIVTGSAQSDAHWLPLILAQQTWRQIYSNQSRGKLEYQLPQDQCMNIFIF